jgi:DNA-binding NtrC family response regulator
MNRVPLRSCVVAGYDAADLPPVKALLDRYGCKAQIVATAREASRLCQTQEIDLVISRVVFAEDGRMNGLDLANDLHGRIPVVLTTEFSDAILHKIPGYPPIDVPVLRPPLDLDALEREIRKAIGGEEASEATS